MIAYVKGTLTSVDERSVVVEANGIGYLVHVSASTISRLPDVGTDVQLLTHLQILENAQSLHGFLSREECRLFLMLISVTGIGPRVATQILATLDVSKLITAIVSDDLHAIMRAPGVGKKTAQRLLLELRDKISAYSREEHAPASDLSSARQDALDALGALGFDRQKALLAILDTDETEAPKIISAVLKRLR